MRRNQHRILFLCTGNSCRSQMAEGFVKHLAGGRFEIYSAGLVPRGLNPRAVKVMREVGIDISSQKSKPIHPALLEPADLIVTLCGHAQEHCPVTPPHIRKTHGPSMTQPDLKEPNKRSWKNLERYETRLKKK